MSLLMTHEIRFYMYLWYFCVCLFVHSQGIIKRKALVYFDVGLRVFMSGSDEGNENFLVRDGAAKVRV